MDAASRGLNPNRPASNNSTPSRIGAALTYAIPGPSDCGSPPKNVVDSVPVRRRSQN